MIFKGHNSRVFWVVDQSLDHAKQLFFENQQTNASFLGLMLGNYTPTRCVIQGGPVYTRSGISIQGLVASHRDKTLLIALNFFSLPIFNE